MLMFFKENKLLFIIFSLFICSNSNSQSKLNDIDNINSTPYEEIVSDLQKYENIFNKNLSEAKRIGYEKGIAKSLSNLALVHYLKGDYDKSTNYHIEAIEIFERNKMYDELSNEYGELGYQMKRRNLGKAIEFMQSAIFIAEKNNLSQFKLSKLYDNYGVLKEMGNEFDSAFYYYNKALQIKKSLNDSIGIPYSLNKIAALKANLGNFKEAYEYLNLSDEFRNKEKGEFGRLENLSLHGDFLVFQNRTDEAIKKFNEVFHIAKQINYSYLMLYSLDNLIKLYKKGKDYEQALDKMELYTTLKDSIDGYNIRSRIAQLEIAYETQNKDRVISENQLKLKAKEQQLIFTISSLILIIIIFIGVYKYQQLKKKKELTEFEFKAKIKSAEMEKKLSDEKLRISRELHDNIGSQLTFIISSLDNIIYKNSIAESKNSINALRDFGRNALSDLRNTIWAMKQQNGTFDSLYLKVNELVSKLNESLNDLTIEINNEVRNDFSLTSTQILNLYRIIQEAIQNAIKHSKASLIKIHFSGSDSEFGFVITDNGKGFNLNENQFGNGITNMKKRCSDIGGELYIESNYSGTKIGCFLNKSNSG
ncbi:ATP-binding protein [Ignavibacterium sp.]|uniref:tetratricopeptide repeat-containing sensor histidine kinase n=1 Tax=Ignavibacterium sp. TaxID=2651167 RepID=UPI00307FC91F